jgi:hypothetical protein
MNAKEVFMRGFIGELTKLSSKSDIYRIIREHYGSTVKPDQLLDTPGSVFQRKTWDRIDAEEMRMELEGRHKVTIEGGELSQRMTPRQIADLILKKRRSSP